MLSFDDVIELHKQGKISDVSMEYCIGMALTNQNWNIRYLAVLHPKATSAHIDKALDDDNPYVRSAAINALMLLSVISIKHWKMSILG